MRFLIWTVIKEPNGWYDFEGYSIYREEPHWYYIKDDKIHCSGYAPGLLRAVVSYLRNVHKTIALNRWYRQGD